MSIFTPEQPSAGEFAAVAIITVFGLICLFLVLFVWGA